MINSNFHLDFWQGYNVVNYAIDELRKTLTISLLPDPAVVQNSAW